MGRIIFTLLAAILTHAGVHSIINDPPTVSLRFELGPWVLANQFYTITVSAADANGDLRQVRVFSGTNEVASSTNASFSASVFILPGTNEFRAVAIDRWQSESAPAVLRIVGNLLPEVEIGPVQAEHNSLEEIPIRISARDEGGTLDIIRLWNGGEWVGEWAPRTAEAVVEIPFTPPGSGSFQLFAEAIDNLGGTSVSTPTEIFVNSSRDDFGPGLPIQTGMLNTSAIMTEATRQKGEPAHAGVAGGKSTWWGWKNTGGAGTAVIDTVGSSFDTVLAVYRLSTTNAAIAFTNLVLVAANDDAPELGTASLVKFSALPGEVYYIAVDGHEGVSGIARLRARFFSPTPAPANDFLAAAAMINIGALIQTTNMFATKEVLEPVHAGNAGGASIWWRLVPVSSAERAVTINTTGSSIDTLLAVYTTNYVGYKPGPPRMADLRLVASNDDTAATNRASQVTFVPRPGVTYYIAVDGFNGAEGAVRLRVSLRESTQPLNDAFAAATVLAGPHRLTNGFTMTATREPGEPLHAGKTNSASVWYRWVAPTNGLVSVSTRTSDFDTVLAVYTGDSLTNLTEVAANDDDPANPPTSAVIFHATAGTEYRFAVAGYQNARGEFVLALNQTPTFQPRLITQWLEGRLWLTVLEGGAGSAVLESSSDLVTWRTARVLSSGDAVAISPDSGQERLFFRTREVAE